MGHEVLGAIRGKKEGRGKRISEAGDSQTLNSKAVFGVSDYNVKIKVSN